MKENAMGEAKSDGDEMQRASIAAHGALGWGFDPNTVSPVSLTRVVEALSSEHMRARDAIDAARAEAAERMNELHQAALDLQCIWDFDTGLECTVCQRITANGTCTECRRGTSPLMVARAEAAANLARAERAEADAARLREALRSAYAKGYSRGLEQSTGADETPYMGRDHTEEDLAALAPVPK